MFGKTFLVTVSCVLSVAALALGLFNNYILQQNGENKIVERVTIVQPTATPSATPSASIAPNGVRRVSPVVSQKVSPVLSPTVTP